MLRSIGYKSILISIIISLFGLLSYLPGMDLLGRINYEYIPMAPSTGVGFLILGISLIVLYMQEISKKILALVLIASLSVSLFGVLEVVGYFIDMDLNYEDSIVPIQGYLNGVPIARMSPATGALFFTSGLSITFFTIQRLSLKQNTLNKLFVAIFGQLSLMVSFTFCLSYLYGPPFFYETHNTIPMALTTAVSFLFLSIAIIFIDVNCFVINFYKDTATRNYLFKFIFPISTLSVIVSVIATIYIIQSSIINPALISATITILIMIFIGLLSHYISRYMGIKIDNAGEEENKIIIESERKFRGTFDQAAVGVARVNLDGTWLEVNKKLSDIVGYTKEELLTKTFQDITHPDDLEDDLNYINQLLHDDIKTYSMHKRYFKKNGDIVWINLTGSLVRKTNNDPDYFVAIIEDITSQKKDQQRLKKSEEKLRDLLNSLSVGVVVHAPDTSIIMNNPKASELLGLNDEQLRGMQAIDPEWNFLDASKDIIPVEEYPVNKIIRTKKQIENMMLGIVQQNTIDVIWVLVNGFPVFNDKNEIIEIIINFVDITELKHKDEMLINQSRQAAMGEMIGMIAHQWRQPISIISMDANNMLLDIAMDKFNETEAEKYANNITLQTKHLSHTIDDFRNFFKPDKVISKVNIRDIFDITLSIVKDSLKNHNIELKISYQTEKEVYAYPRELMQVFVNIINNAKDALSFKNKKNSIIDIEVYEDETYINTKICDNGGGIDADILSKVFDPYFSTKDEKTGTGLGLYMSKMIIEKHLNGVIEVYSSNKGACFTVKLLKQD
ncbi:multi-sensor signal transduction histidine kinase [Sulfurimonas gotlandica GD1]|uniref:histidine kinase n=1 Tax=Sulfurimonas gotlandica (strain DSM 19862 / JCM 16533 / GD1) TaxID=929558 RepID=B6BLE0_SULGG|nr:PAS domain-containing sensor histidine kinase [Sulfurimonas gotlandica]EDZ62119.1 multi-sensor signal transduction histidine kinase [Sulfurimonas gotlandica GD1]EHP28594.1 multi-sensor signal transduction histidine kinase [Sulfurimonas gotlandica GD1]